MATCKTCRMPLCATCDFSFSGGVHLCPDCVTRSQGKMGDKRRKTLTWAYVLAGWSSLALIGLLVLGATGLMDDEEAATVIGGLFSIFGFLPAMVGIGLGVGSLDRRLGNPPAVWIAAIWNGLILGTYVLLIIAGNFMG